jgi:hypothetical protein
MDVFAHFLWSVALFWHQRHRLYAGLIGVLPDLLSFGLLFVTEITHHLGRQGPPPLDSLPGWLFVMYSITHSLVIWGLLFAVVWIVLRKPPIILGAWGIHIVSDVFTHSPSYFPTPLFWPISDWKYMYGVRWSMPVFMVINYAAIAIVYILIFKHWVDKKKAHKV